MCDRCENKNCPVNEMAVESPGDDAYQIHPPDSEEWCVYRDGCHKCTMYNCPLNKLAIKYRLFHPGVTEALIHVLVKHHNKN